MPLAILGLTFPREDYPIRIRIRHPSSQMVLIVNTLRQSVNDEHTKNVGFMKKVYGYSSGRHLLCRRVDS